VRRIHDAAGVEDHHAAVGLELPAVVDELVVGRVVTESRFGGADERLPFVGGRSPYLEIHGASLTSRPPACSAITTGACG